MFRSFFLSVIISPNKPKTQLLQKHTHAYTNRSKRRRKKKKKIQNISKKEKEKKYARTYQTSFEEKKITFEQRTPYNVRCSKFVVCVSVLTTLPNEVEFRFQNMYTLGKVVTARLRTHVSNHTHASAKQKSSAREGLGELLGVAMISSV